MPTDPRPSVMLAIGLLLGALAFSAGWTTNGWRKDADIKSIELGHAKALKASVDDLAKSNAAVQAANDQARDGVTKLVEQRYEEYQRDQQEIARLNDAVRSGAQRLSIAVRSCAAPSIPTSGATATAAEPPKARADIDPGAAGYLVSITQRGNEAIKDLNQCIDIYNEVRNKLNKKTAP